METVTTTTQPIRKEESMNPIPSAHHAVVYHDPAKWAATPANNGANGPVWQWNDELLVGFTVGTFLRAQDGHQCTYDKPFHSWLARRVDGGETWNAWKPEGYAGQPAASRELARPVWVRHALRVSMNGDRRPDRR